MTGQVSCVVDAAVAIVTIDNSARLNAIDLAIAVGLADVTRDLAQRDDVNAILLRGAGLKAFSAGVDLKAAEASGNRPKAFADIEHAMLEAERTLAAMSIPTVAMLSGVCYGGGVQLSSMADFRVASNDLKQSVPAIANRLFYPIPALERLAAIMGWACARRMIYASAPFDVATLLQWGFVDQIADPIEIETAALDFARTLAAKPREIVAAYRAIFAALERGDRTAAEHLRQEAKALELSRRKNS